MRVVVITRENTDYARAVETFLTDFTRRTGKTLEVMDADSREADSFIQAYGVMSFPAVVALSDDGQVLNMWTGVMLPTISEVSYYVS